MTTVPNTQTPRIDTVAFVSLGCPKNLVDSEKMLGLLAEDGLMPIGDETQADAIVINTCGFLEASKDESVEEINRAAELKKAGQIKRIIVAGCLVQRHRAKMLQWCPDIDAMIGVFDRDRIVEAVRGTRPTQKDIAVELPVYSSIAANATVAVADGNDADINIFARQEHETASERSTQLRTISATANKQCNRER